MKRLFVALFIGLALISTACSSEAPAVPTDGDKTSLKGIMLKNMIADLKSQPAKDAEFELIAEQVDSVNTVVTILANNPSAQAVTGAQAWLTYPESITAVKIDTSNSAFDIAAPNEDDIDRDAGIVKIGRSKTGDPVNATQLELAKVVFAKKPGSQLALIDFLAGHMQINVVQDNDSYNIALQSSPLTI